MDTTNPKEQDDRNGFYVECSSFRKSNKNKKCTIDFVEIDSAGHLTAKIRNIYPKKNDIIYINYSTKISKNAPTGKHKCADISPDDFDFNKCINNPVDLKNVETIYVYNNPPDIEWSMDCSNESVLKSIDSLIYYSAYVVYNGTEITLSCLPSDPDNNLNELHVSLLDNYTPSGIEGYGTVNKTFMVNIPGIHIFNIKVNDNETGTPVIDGKSYFFEVLNITYSEQKLIDAINKHKYLYLVRISIFSLILSIIFILPNIYIVLISQSSNRLYKNYIDNIIIILSILISITAFVAIYVRYNDINKIILFDDIYIYEAAIYTWGFIISTNIVRLKTHRTNVETKSDTEAGGACAAIINVMATDNEKTTTATTEKSTVKYNEWDWVLVSLISTGFISFFHLSIPGILDIGSITSYVAIALLGLLVTIIINESTAKRKPRTTYGIFTILLIIGATILYIYINSTSIIGLQYTYEFKHLISIFIIEFVLLITFLCSPTMPHIIRECGDLLKNFKKPG